MKDAIVKAAPEADKHPLLQLLVQTSSFQHSHTSEATPTTYPGTSEETEWVVAPTLSPKEQEREATMRNQMKNFPTILPPKSEKDKHTASEPIIQEGEPAESSQSATKSTTIPGVVPFLPSLLTVICVFSIAWVACRLLYHQKRCCDSPVIAKEG